MKKHLLVMLVAALAVACSTKTSDGGGSDGDDDDDTTEEPGGKATTTPSDTTGDDDDDTTPGEKDPSTETWDCTGDLNCLFLDENGDSEKVSVFFYGDGDTCKFDDPADKVATLEIEGGKVSSDGDLVGSYTFDKTTKRPTALHWDVGQGQRSLSGCKP